ncbi:MAG TPA: lamin tail domain-containing protein [Cytophagales bacterium]|nr:lamin tail domain-containing protein [Cytophagales bacterium]
MRLFYWLFIFCGANLISYFSYSQINTFPYFQDFESDFVPGINVEFLPFWVANEVKPSSRVFKEATNMLNGTGALGLTPTSSYSPEITVSLDFSTSDGAKLAFYARSLANGTGTYLAILELSVSVDEGASFSTPEEISTFANADSPYALYNFNFPSSIAGQSGVVLKIKLKRGTPGSGSTATVVMEDFKITEEVIEVPEVGFGQIQINEIFADPSGADAPDSMVLPEVEFVELFNAGVDTINLKDFSLSGSKIPSFQLLPDSYVIICSNNKVSEFLPFGETIGLSTWNTLTNTGEKLRLEDPVGKIIDSLSYNLDWYRDKNKQTGGWSIEQINPSSECFGSYNWKASESTYGGTPGIKNSVYSIDKDSTPLATEKLIIKDKLTLEVRFNKPLLPTFIKNQIKVSPALNINSIDFSTFYDAVIINLSDSIHGGIIYNMTFENVEDCSSSRSSLPEVSFGLGVSPAYNDLVISEIMADPSPVKGLTEVEYLELFNRSNKIISLKDVILTDELSLTSLPEETIFPGEYMVLCPSSSLDYFKQTCRAISPGKWLSLNNSGEIISLTYLDKTIFSVAYSDEWYNDMEKKEGGFSLEMANIDLPCLEDGNWFASLDDAGGTPGRANSNFEQIIDLTGPSISDIEVLTASDIRVNFNEKVENGSLLVQQLSLSPSVEIKSIKDVGITKKVIAVNFALPLSPKIIYTLQAKDLKDCSGNIGSSSFDFAIPEEADSLDVIINELLFNPRPYGVDFIEIYNRSDKFLSLNGWKLGAMNEDTISDTQLLTGSKSLLKPNEMLVLTPDPDILINEYPLLVKENIIKVTLPSLPDEGGNIVLTDSTGVVIDFFEYSESYHYDFLLSNEGVSLERINIEGSTNDKNNWHSASEDAGFATPGYRNSQFKDELNTNKFIKIDPPVFSPDGDGYNDFTLINFLFEEPGNMVSVNLYDKEGRILKNLIDNQTLSLNGFIQWNGEDNNGNRVKSGIYLVLIEIFTSTGEKRKYKKEVIVATKL